MPPQTPELPPHTLETIPPVTAQEAFEDLFRFMAWHSTRAEARAQIEAMDIANIVHAIQGRQVGGPLSGSDLLVANTVEYCVRRGLLRGPIETVGIIEGVRGLLRDGGIFIGQERTPEEKGLRRTALKRKKSLGCHYRIN